jgi:glucose/arabinose dehydrogenase
MKLNKPVFNRLAFGLAVALFALFSSIPYALTAPVANLSLQDQESLTIKLEQIISGLNQPVYVTHAGDRSGRLFIVEQPGRIFIYQNGSLLQRPFLDIRSRISSGGERGLLSVAFHPLFEQNRRFFVDYTRSGDGATVIAEYKTSEADPNLSDLSERILLVIPQPFANHNGGQLQFGPDGFLYIGMGDGGSGGDPQNNGQNNESLLGKILRIDVDKGQPYSSPVDNPFFGSIPGRDEIYATGFRNPWRFSFDPFTGELYAGDVGQNKLEEVDIVVKGGNYGWRTMEGSQCFNPASGCNRNGLILPITEYGRDVGCSITGGYVYRGMLSPALEGVYIYGDFCTGIILGYRAGVSMVLLRSGKSISSFGRDEQGELYAIDYQGTISRIIGPSVSSDTTPPTVVLLSPNGGEKIKAGSRLVINWQSSDNVRIATHDVLLSTDGGATYQIPIATGLSGTKNSFVLDLPRDQETIKKAKIKIVATDLAGNKGQDESDANFKIKAKKAN